MNEKLSDYVIRFIAERGVKHIFLVPGGGAMHLNDSLGRSRDVQFISTLHEQAAAIAAEGYARVTNQLGVAMVTSGPGGTNAVTGVAGAWLDSTPCLFLSGQVKRADLMTGLGVRQFGVQEIDIVSVVAPITKYAVTVTEPTSIRYHLEKAVYLARSGRPGPVWLDLPLDVQATMIDSEELMGFSTEGSADEGRPTTLGEQVDRVVNMLNQSRRPALLVGNGVRLAGAVDTFRRLVDTLGIPVMTTWLGLDLIDGAHPLLAGRPGSLAPRGANFALQSCDLLLVLGARLDLALTAYAHERFAPAAAKVMIDVDAAEIRKMKTRIDLPIQANAGVFIVEMLARSGDLYRKDRTVWLERCRQWREKYPIVLPEHHSRMDGVSTYVLSEAMSEELAPDDVIVPTSSGLTSELFILAFRVKEGQRVYHNRGTGAMGFALPSSIGACLASGGRRTICLEGDGGLQLNIQELETVARLGLPIKIFVLSNQGYASIRASQQRYFGRLVGADATSGLTLPDVTQIARAYGLPCEVIAGHAELRTKLRVVLGTPGPVVCDIRIAPNEVRAPCVSSRQLPDGSMMSTPLEDLWPFLDRDELVAQMSFSADDEGVGRVR